MLQVPSPHKGVLEEGQGQGLDCVPAQAGTQSETTDSSFVSSTGHLLKSAPRPNKQVREGLGHNCGFAGTVGEKMDGSCEVVFEPPTSPGQNGEKILPTKSQAQHLFQSKLSSWRIPLL